MENIYNTHDYTTIVNKLHILFFRTFFFYYYVLLISDIYIYIRVKPANHKLPICMERQVDTMSTRISYIYIHSLVWALSAGLGILD